MSSAQWQPDLELIRPLLEAPYRYEFIQAVRLLERWIAAQAPTAQAPADLLRFQNSLALTFPASQIESLKLVFNKDGAALERIEITPAFIGLLGACGALPVHTTERLAAHSQRTHDDGARAFHDLFFHRLMALLYSARQKHRLDAQATGHKRQSQLHVPHALSGMDGDASLAPGAMREAAAYHVAAIRQRPSSAVALERALSEHFGVHIAVLSNAGRWHRLAAQHRDRLAGPNKPVLGRTILGARQWRQDLDCVLRIGPLARKQFDSFLPGQPAAQALKQMVGLFNLPGIRFEVCLVLRKEDVVPTVLGTTRAGLGQGLYMVRSPAAQDRADTRYIL